MSLKCSYHPFQQNTLMGSMLINQVQAICTLSHNIALRQLTNDAQRGQVMSCLRRKGLLMYFGAPNPHKGGHYIWVRWRSGLVGPDPHKGGHYRLIG